MNLPPTKTLDLGDNVRIELVLIATGSRKAMGRNGICTRLKQVKTFHLTRKYHINVPATAPNS